MATAISAARMSLLRAGFLDPACPVWSVVLVVDHRAPPTASGAGNISHEACVFTRKLPVGARTGPVVSSTWLRRGAGSPAPPAPRGRSRYGSRRAGREIERHARRHGGPTPGRHEHEVVLVEAVDLQVELEAVAGHTVDVDAVDA